jgi:hypothetical protein
VNTWYRSPEEAVVSFGGPEVNDIVAEGPFAWLRQGERTGVGKDADKRFALGHQYHAMLLHFDEMMASAAPDGNIEFMDSIRTGRSGGYPNGGSASLVEGEQPDQPFGLLLLLPEESPIEVTFGDWRLAEAGQVLPYRVEISHRDVVFTYEYQSIELAQADALDFHERYPSPEIEEVDLYRMKVAEAATRCRNQQQ